MGQLHSVSLIGQSQPASSPTQSADRPAGALDRFTRATGEFFATQAKSFACNIHRTDTSAGTILRIDHGHYLKTLPHWREAQVQYTNLRPAKQDVLFYESGPGLLHIRAGLERDREEYVRLFAREIADDEDLATHAARQPLFTLRPLSYGTFSFAGDGEEILWVHLTAIRMKVFGATRAYIRLSSRDVLESLKTDFNGISLAAGDLLEARFRFTLRPKGGKIVDVSAVVKPPARTAFSKTRFGEIIERYLEKQGVRIT